MREKQLVISKPIRGGKTLVYHQEPVTPDKKMTIKEKIMMFMSKAKPPVLINDFINSDQNHCRTRRPLEKATIYGTNDALGGRDPLGQHGMKGGYPSDNENVMETNKTKAVYYKNKDMLKNIVFDAAPEKEADMLKEDNIKDLGN